MKMGSFPTRKPVPWFFFFPYGQLHYCYEHEKDTILVMMGMSFVTALLIVEAYFFGPR